MGSKAEEHVAQMKTPTNLTKIRSSRRRYNRAFHLDNAATTLTYDGSTKNKTIQRILRRPPDMSRIPISDIQDVRKGAESDVLVKALNENKLEDPLDHCFTIVVGARHRPMDLIAKNKEQRDQWVHGLRFLSKKYSQADLATKQKMWRRKLFNVADTSKDKVLSFNEVYGLLEHMSVGIDRREGRKLFDKADFDKKLVNGEPVLDEEEFLKFCDILTQRDEMNEIFDDYNDSGEYWDVKQLQTFLQKEQKIDVTKEECENMIETFEKCPEIKEQKLLSKPGFCNMMYSRDMSLLGITNSSIYQDMTRPLDEYYINSSHNTYLLKDQLVGPSSVEAYIRALVKGCRCVELDCWDGNEGDPVIYHGYTMTSKIRFRDTLEGINDYAFKDNEYPIILSIENHCSIEQQKVMAAHLKDVFGERLYTEPLPEDAKGLPSPSELIGKVVLKGKKLPPRVSLLTEEDEVSDEDEAADVPDDQVQQVAKKTDKGKKRKLAQELSDLIVIFQSVHFHDFEHTKEHYNFKQMSSFGEKKAFSLMEDQPWEFIQHNRLQISRIYPGGLRTDSSNYDPNPMWNIGAQIVALNYQTAGEQMEWNMGRFAANGRCGYVLKPDFLTKGKDKFNPHGMSFPSKWQKRLTITIISGWQLPKGVGSRKSDLTDPYVQLDIVGVEADQHSSRTHTVMNNGFNPMWNSTFDWVIKVPELALLKLTVKDEDSSSSDDFVGFYCLPVDSLQQGYRSVQLWNQFGKKLWPSSLFVHVKLQ